MMLSSKSTLLAAVFTLVSATSEVWAAGVVPPQRPQLTQGRVIGVQRGNGQPAFRVRTMGMNGRAGLAGNQNGVAPALQNGQAFIVGPGTQFEATNGWNLVPASFAALRSGQQVIVESQGVQAVRVRILPRNQNAGRARRSRMVAYPPSVRGIGRTAAQQMLGAVGPVAAGQAAKMPHANHGVRNASAARATQVKSRKR